MATTPNVYGAEFYYNNTLSAGNEKKLTSDGNNNAYGFDDNVDVPTGTDADNGNWYVSYWSPVKDTLFFTKITGGEGTNSTAITIDVPHVDNFSIHSTHLYANNGTIDIFAPVGSGSGALYNVTHYRSTDDGVSFNKNSVATGESSVDPFWATVKGDNLGMFWRSFTGSAHIEASASTNGGTTWTTPVLIDPLDGTYVDGSSDNFVMEIDSTGQYHHLFYRGEVTDTNDWEFFYSRSTDFGATYSNPVVITNGLDETGSLSGQPYAIVNGTDVTFLYFADIVGSFSTADYRFKQIQSTDNGATWGSETILFDGASTCHHDEHTNGSQNVAFDGTNIIYICSGVNDVDLFYSITNDMGDNWSALSTVLTHSSQDNLDLYRDEMIVDMEGDVISVISVYADAGAGSEVDTGGDSGEHIVYSLDGGTTWSEESRKTGTDTPPSWSDMTTRVSGDTEEIWHGFEGTEIDLWFTYAQPPSSLLGSEVIFSLGNGQATAEIGHTDENDYPTGSVATNTGMYYVWVENVIPARQIHFTHFPSSTPETQTTPVIIDTINDNVRYLYIFADGMTLDVIVGYDDATGSRESLAHYRSTDNGVTWDSQTEIYNGSTEAEIGGVFPNFVDVEGDTISAVYRVTSDNSPWNNPVYVDTSTDGGTTWNSRVHLYNDTNYTFEDKRIVIDGSDIHLAYYETNPTPNEIVYYRSTDTGTTFSSPVTVSSGFHADNRSVQVEIAVDGSDVSIFFIGAGNTANTFSQVRSSDGGATWGAQEDIFDGSVCDWEQFRQSEKTIDIDGRTIQVVCAGNSNMGGYTARSTDMGATWTSLVSYMTTDPTFWVVGDDNVAINGDNIYITFQINDSPTPNFTGFTYSPDAGATWATEQWQDTGQNDAHIKISPSNEHLWIGYDRNPSGELQTYYATFTANPTPPDTTPPVITLLGDNPQEVDQNEAYVEAGATCTDDVDGDISGSVIIGGSVDTGTVGQYFVTYDCQDTAGNNATQETRTVNVNEVVSSGGGGSGDSGVLGQGIPQQPIFTTLTGLSFTSGTQSAVPFSNADIAVLAGETALGVIDIAWNGNNDLTIDRITVPPQFEDWFEFIGESESNSVFTSITLEADPDELRQFTSIDFLVSPPEGTPTAQYRVPIVLEGEDSIGNSFKIEQVYVIDTGSIFADPVFVWSFIAVIGILIIVTFGVYRKRQYKRRRNMKRGKRGSFADQLDSLNKF